MCYISDATSKQLVCDTLCIHFVLSALYAHLFILFRGFRMLLYFFIYPVFTWLYQSGSCLEHSFDIFQEWKERKKFQKRLIAAKKKLCEMEQQHIFHGFRFGEKSQTSLLADQIVCVNSKLLQQALQNIEITSRR